jgi:hypothetical protein
MIKNSCYVLIVYVAEQQYQRIISGYLLETFISLNYNAKILSATETQMNDIAAADIIVFGSFEKNHKISESGYSEINRSLQGINLSGRIAAFFTYQDEPEIIQFEKMLEPSGIHLYRKPLLYNKDTGTADTNIWADTLKTIHEERLDG